MVHYLFILHTGFSYPGKNFTLFFVVWWENPRLRSQHSSILYRILTFFNRGQLLSRNGFKDEGFVFLFGIRLFKGICWWLYTNKLVSTHILIFKTWPFIDTFFQNCLELTLFADKFRRDIIHFYYNFPRLPTIIKALLYYFT